MSKETEIETSSNFALRIVSSSISKEKNPHLVNSLSELLAALDLYCKYVFTESENLRLIYNTFFTSCRFHNVQEKFDSISDVNSYPNIAFRIFVLNNKYSDFDEIYKILQTLMNKEITATS